MQGPDEGFIEEEARRIRAKLLHGIIYGVYITENASEDALIVAAYHAGKMEQMLRDIEENKKLYNLLLNQGGL